MPTAFVNIRKYFVPYILFSNTHGEGHANILLTSFEKLVSTVFILVFVVPSSLANHVLIGLTVSLIESPRGVSQTCITRRVSAIVLMPANFAPPTTSAALPHTASVLPQAMALPGVGSGSSFSLLPPIVTTVLSTMCRAALLSTPSRCAGACCISSDALCTEKIVVPGSNPLAVVPAVHLFLPMLTREPMVREPTRYGSPVHTPLITCLVMNDRSSWRKTCVSACGTDRRTECASTCGSALAETCFATNTGSESYLPESFSFRMYAAMCFSCSSLKKRSSCALRIAWMDADMMLTGWRL
mmetsp:Transcript_11071/g.40998  ORF Transcript_11071/g.40998 Transcript_11071/m.40998 type:complete len:299 (+) Transcript_11071:914-1810(+)